MHAMTKVKLKPITRDNYMDAFRLKVHPAQEDLVADNIGSLAQAYVFDYARPFGIYRGDEAVGFVMLSLEDIEEGEVWVWRFMIGSSLQRQGLGTLAMQAIIEHVQSMPEATTIKLSHAPREGGAGPFYTGLGFTYTGEIEHEEPVMEMKLSNGPR